MENSDLKLFSVTDKNVKVETCADFENLVPNLLKTCCASELPMQGRFSMLPKYHVVCLARHQRFLEFSHLKNATQKYLKIAHAPFSDRKTYFYLWSVCCYTD